jgi:hypothetical protein
VATSFTEFRGLGMHCRDGTMAVWLAALVDELDARVSHTGWLGALRDEWYALATVGFDGHMSTNLDSFLTSDERRAAVVALCKSARERIAVLGAPANGTLAGRIGAWLWAREGATARVLRVADGFLWLLDGER